MESIGTYTIKAEAISVAKPDKPQRTRDLDKDLFYRFSKTTVALSGIDPPLVSRRTLAVIVIY
jgi:hypothetical protein